MAELAERLGALFPQGVGASSVTIGCAPAPWPEEAGAMRHAVPKRRAEFAAGRAAARAALAACGLPAAAIPMADDRAPVWPEGIAGSITHTPDMALAVVAPRSRLTGLGVDAEPDLPLPEDLLPDICDTEERAWIALQDDPLRSARLIFVAKEAAYKCQYPLSRKLLGFDAITIDVASEAGGLNARFNCDAAPFARGDVIHGHFKHLSGLIVAWFKLGSEWDE